MLIILILAAAGVGALVWLAAFTFVCVAARVRRPLSSADCIVVLGAKLRPDGSMTGTLEKRVRTAVNAAKRLDTVPVIMSGGHPHGQSKTEAAAMAEGAAAMGLDQARIIIEEMSTDTLSNMQNSLALMRKMGLSSAVVVTSDYHMARALRIARDAGMTAAGFPAPSPARKTSYWRARSREVMGWGLYFRRRFFGR